MKFYLFSRSHRQIEADFRIYYIRENLKVLKNLSIVYFLAVVAIIVTCNFAHLNLDDIVNIPGFFSSLYATLFVMPGFYLLSRLLLKKFKPKKKALLLSQALVVLFAMYLISRGLLNTFYAMHNPRNSLTMYMIWLTTISIFFVLEYYETLFLSVVFLIAFSVILPYYQHDTNELLKNNLVSVLLLTVFFVSSRNIYSYRATHFMQLKTIRDKNLEIENANHIKDEILGIVAHDLRNPLAAIESIAQLMELENEIEDENLKNNLSMIKTSCEKARFIINDLLEAALNDSVDNFGVEDVELNGFLKTIVDQWLQNKTSFSQLVFNGTKQRVYASINRVKIQRVMDNLISNAMKFSIDSNHVEVILKQTSSGCSIEVKDFGLGIPPEMLPYVFDRFSKAGRKGLRGEDSVGMGLNIASQIIKKHGGNISVESVEQMGTTFTIALPQ